MALIHKTKKEEGKKHKTKKKTQKKQKIFRIELRKDRFRMFGPYSKPISAISVASRYSRILAESAPFGANRSRISANPRERERERGKKKSSDAAPMRRSPVRYPPNRIGVSKTNIPNVLRLTIFLLIKFFVIYQKTN